MAKTKKSAAKAKKGEVALAILKGVGTVGLLMICLAAPNAAQIATLVMKKERRYAKTSIQRSLNTVMRRGWVEFERTPNGYRVILTEAGRAELLTYELAEKMLRKPRRWDKKWRLLIFDIAEKRKYVRESLRRMLVQLGFYRLQDSVWVYPYDCEDIMELLRTKYRVRHDALFVRADHIANDRELCRHFGLIQ